MAEPTVGQRREDVLELTNRFISMSKIEPVVDALIAAVLAEPSAAELEIIQTAADQIELADDRIVPLTITAYRRLRGAK